MRALFQGFVSKGARLRPSAQTSLLLALPFAGLLPGQLQAQALPVSGYVPSLQSENSYFLFHGDYDHLQDPSRLALLDNNSLYTLLANNAGYATYGLGFSAPVGPGGLGLLFSSTGQGDESQDVTEEVDQTSGAVKSRVTETSYDRYRNFNLYAAYGVPMVRFQLGVGLRVNVGREDTSVDEFLALGGNNGIYEDLETQQTETVEGSAHFQTDSYQLILSGGFGDEAALSVQTDLMIGTVVRRSVVNMTQQFDEYTAEATGIYTTSPLANSNEIKLGLEVRPRWVVNRSLSLEAFLGAELGVPTLVDSSFNYHENDYSGAFDTESDVSVSLAATELKDNAFTAFLAGHFQVAPGTEFRMGLGMLRRTYHLDYNTTSSTQTIVSDSDPFTYVTEEQSVYTSAYSQLTAPVALEYRISDKLTARLGARFMLSSYENEQFEAQLSSIVNGESQPINENQVTSSDAGWTPSSQYALGLAFNPTPRVDTELLLTNGGVSTYHTAYTSSPVSIFGSATIHW